MIGFTSVENDLTFSPQSRGAGVGVLLDPDLEQEITTQMIVMKISVFFIQRVFIRKLFFGGTIGRLL